MEDIVYSIFGVILVLVGLVGSILPVLPGSSISWFGFLIFKLSSFASYAWWLVWIMLVLAIMGVVFDYIIPIWGTKKMGGSKYGVGGTFLGLFVGIIFSPFGFVSIIIMPFFGALLGELLYNSENKNRAVKAAFGSFLGFLATTGYGLFLSCVMMGFILYSFWNNIW